MEIRYINSHLEVYTLKKILKLEGLKYCRKENVNNWDAIIKKGNKYIKLEIKETTKAQYFRTNYLGFHSNQKSLFDKNKILVLLVYYHDKLINYKLIENKFNRWVINYGVFSMGKKGFIFKGVFIKPLKNLNFKNRVYRRYEKEQTKGLNTYYSI